MMWPGALQWQEGRDDDEVLWGQLCRLQTEQRQEALRVEAVGRSCWGAKPPRNREGSHVFGGRGRRVAELAPGLGSLMDALDLG